MSWRGKKSPDLQTNEIQTNFFLRSSLIGRDGIKHDFVTVSWLQQFNIINTCKYSVWLFRWRNLVLCSNLNRFVKQKQNVVPMIYFVYFFAIHFKNSTPKPFAHMHQQHNEIQRSDFIILKMCFILFQNELNKFPLCVVFISSVSIFFYLLFVYCIQNKDKSLVLKYVIVSVHQISFYFSFFFRFLFVT